MGLYVDIPSHADLLRLLRVRRAGCVSVVLPTSPITAEADRTRRELGNVAREAAAQLDAAGADAADTAAVTDALSELAGDEGFWAHQAHALAVFANADGTTTFRLPNRLTSALEVSDRFHVKPLLRAVTFPQAAYVLALSQGGARLLQITPDADPVQLPITEGLGDVESMIGGTGTKLHGQSGRVQNEEGQKVRMRQFARHVDETLRPVLRGQDLPLILAAAEPIAAIFRSVCGYPHLAAPGLTGNPDRVPDGELAQSARGVLDELNATELDELRERFRDRENDDRATDDLGRVARAATLGAVDTVLVDMDHDLSGSIHEETGAVELDDEDDAVNYDVLDEMARRVLLSGGRVLAVRASDLPSSSPVAALLRYAV